MNCEIVEYQFCRIISCFQKEKTNVEAATKFLRLYEIFRNIQKELYGKRDAQKVNELLNLIIVELSDPETIQSLQKELNPISESDEYFKLPSLLRAIIQSLGPEGTSNSQIFKDILQNNFVIKNTDPANKTMLTEDEIKNCSNFLFDYETIKKLLERKMYVLSGKDDNFHIDGKESDPWEYKNYCYGLNTDRCMQRCCSGFSLVDATKVLYYLNRVETSSGIIGNENPAYYVREAVLPTLEQIESTTDKSFWIHLNGIYHFNATLDTSKVCLGERRSLSDPNIFKEFVANGANMLDPKCNEIIVNWASQLGFLDILKYLTSIGGSLITKSGIPNAAWDGHQHVIEYLLKNGVDINSHDEYRPTALMVAVKEENLGLVKYLLENGANVSIYKEGTQVMEVKQDRILEQAMFNKNIVEYCKNIVENALCEEKHMIATNPLHTGYLTERISGDDGKSKVLVLSYKDMYESSLALIQKRLNRTSEIVKLLLDAGADVNVVNKRLGERTYKINGDTQIHRIFRTAKLHNEVIKKIHIDNKFSFPPK